MSLISSESPASTTMYPSSRVPEMIYVPLPLIVITLPEILTEEEEDVAEEPLSVMVSASLSS